MPRRHVLLETYIAEANFAAWQMQATVNTPASAGLALGRTPASRTRYSPADFKTPGSQRQPRGSMQSPGESAGGGTPSMSVPRVRTSSKARPSRLRPGNPATPTAQQVHPAALYSCHACCLRPSIYVLVIPCAGQLGLHAHKVTSHVSGLAYFWCGTPYSDCKAALENS